MTALARTDNPIQTWFARVTLAAWWGGLTVYSAVVVPVGSEVTDKTTQGFVTQQVTWWLLGLTTIALVTNAKEVFTSGQRFRRSAWWTLAVSVPLAAGVHWSLDGMLDSDGQSVIADDAVFYRRHQIYLWLTVVQWVGGLVLLWPVSPKRADCEEQTDSGEERDS